ncbi:dTDP-4-amino-4,6-dideoxyglucose formyltransferase [bacterium]|nr:dTDP-4-amino-4,6-dideoxyglucose formyltransferase [bacterium]
MKKVLILTDNPFGYTTASELKDKYDCIDIYQSPNGPLSGVKRLNVKERSTVIAHKYDVVFSIHCKQLFPVEMVECVRCINVHPGFNPIHRGWFPHVFSIMDGQKAGVTIHEIDAKLDHGPIIVQLEYNIKDWDTSASVYEALMRIERDLLLENFERILNRGYDTFIPEEGNVNYFRDYRQLLEINLEEVGTYHDLINKLRALTHPPYKNAYFIDSAGNKVFVSINLEKDK